MSNKKLDVASAQTLVVDWVTYTDGSAGLIVTGHDEDGENLTPATLVGLASLAESQIRTQLVKGGLDAERRRKAERERE